MDTTELGGTGTQECGFLSLAETLSFFIVLVRDERVLYVNPAACAVLERSKASLVGLAFCDLVHPDDRERALIPGRAPAEPGRRVVQRLVRPDGRALWLDCSVDPIELGDGKAWLVAGSDVTERKQLEEDLRRSRANLAEAQRIAGVGAWEWEIATDRVSWSDEFFRICGLDLARVEPSYERYIAMLHPDDRDAARDTAAAAVQAPQVRAPFQTELRLIRPDGDVRALWTSGRVDVDDTGRAVRMYGIVQDVTDRRRAEQALRESEQRFRNLCTQAPVMLMAFNPDGRVRDVSNHWLSAMGYARDDVVGHEGWDFIAPESRARLRHCIEENQRNGRTVIQNLPLRVVRKDGTALDVLSTSVGEIGDDGESKGAICVMINLSELQRAEQALRESEERYRALVEHAPEAILVYDADVDRYVDANAHAQRLLGYPRERLLTMSPLDFCPESGCSDYDASSATRCEIASVLAGNTAMFESSQIDASGREFPCQIRFSKLPATGRSLVRVTITDISEQKELQQRIKHAEQMAAVGMLAAGVAHEIGNPLHALSMAAQSLERRASDDYGKRKLALIREHIDRIARIVRQMGDHARTPSRTPAAVDANQIVRRALEVIRHDKRADGAEIRFELSEDLPPVQAVEDELTQVCINLALNAFDAMASLPPGRPRRLTIRSEATDSKVKVSFQDTGPGVPREARTRLFQPFFTTKGVGKGTGLGLSLSYRILEAHRGTLRLDERASPGAAFVFELPLAKAS
jgi:PAS domain S-box-containing protein